jgi:hypothetical protein
LDSISDDLPTATMESPRNRAIVDDTTLRVHRHDDSMDDKQVGFILREAWQCHEQRDETANKHRRTESEKKVSHRAGELTNHGPAYS